MLPILLMLLQNQPAPAVVPQRFSILAQPCAPLTRDGKEVVVCGTNPAVSQRLPLPDQAEPTPGYVKPDSQDYRNNKGGNGACVIRGCQVGFGPPIMPMIAAAATAIDNARKGSRWAAARKRDGTRRVPITLDGDGPKGRIEP